MLPSNDCKRAASLEWLAVHMWLRVEGVPSRDNRRPLRPPTETVELYNRVFADLFEHSIRAWTDKGLRIQIAALRGSRRTANLRKSTLLIQKVRSELSVKDNVSILDHMKSKITAECLIASESDQIAIARHAELETQLAESKRQLAESQQRVAVFKASDFLRQEQVLQLKAAAENQADLHLKAVAEKDELRLTLKRSLHESQQNVAVFKAAELLRQKQVAHLKATAENQADLHSKSAAEKAELRITLKKSLRALRDSRKRSKAKTAQLSAVKKELRSARSSQKKASTDVKNTNQRKRRRRHSRNTGRRAVNAMKKLKNNLDKVSMYLPPKPRALLETLLIDRADEEYEKKVSDLRSEACVLQKENEARFAAFYAGANCSQETLRELLSPKFYPSGQQHGCSAHSVRRRYREKFQLLDKLGLDVLVTYIADSKREGHELACVHVEDLDAYLRRIICSSPVNFTTGDTATLRIGVDGRELAVNNGTVIFTIAVMTPQCVRLSHEQHHLHTLALIEGGETYENLISTCRVLDEWLSRLNRAGLTLLDGSTHINLQSKLCGDMKALAVVLGLSTNFGSCSFPCVKCYKPRKRDGFQCHYDTDDASVASCPYWRGSAARRDWAAAASMDRSRSSFSKKPEEHRGHLRERLFPFAFPNDNDILCDTLHSMLRIVDKLLASLLELSRKTGAQLDEDPSLGDARLSNELSRAAKVTVSLHTDDAGRSKFGRLWGQGKLNLCKHVVIRNIFPDDDHLSNEDCERWQAMFTELHILYSAYNKLDPLESDHVPLLKALIEHWTDLFRSTLGPQAITPYVHCLEAHFLDMIGSTVFKSLSAFGTWSLERKNGADKRAFFNSTLKNGGKFNRRDNNTPVGNNLKYMLQREMVLRFTSTSHYQTAHGHTKSRAANRDAHV